MDLSAGHPLASRISSGGTAEVILRPFEDNDLAKLVDLINDTAAADGSGLRMSAERLEKRIRFLGADLDRNLCLAVVKRADDLVGYVILHPKWGQTADAVLMAGCVRPDQRKRGIGTMLFQWAIDRAAIIKRDRPLHLDLAQYGNPAGMPELASKFGFSVARVFLMLLKPELDSVPPPTIPPGLTIRHFIPGQDESALNAAVNAAFADNWGYSPTTDETATRMYHSGYYDYESMLVAEDSDGICGHCFVRFDLAGRNPDGGSHALMGSLGVVHRQRGRGLGRALLVAGLNRLRAIGAQSAVLSVDADEIHGALRLYEKAGFQLLSTDRAWRKTIE